MNFVRLFNHGCFSIMTSLLTECYKWLC